jgi:hypothetical protein
MSSAAMIRVNISLSVGAVPLASQFGSGAKLRKEANAISLFSQEIEDPSAE